METLLKDVEPRLQKGFSQLRTEIIIFERLMYKNANQHRRALYFRRLCQVRRDLRLLQSAHLADLIQNIAQYFGNTLKEPSRQKGILQSKSTSSEIQDLKRRMYGVAKLMEQMSDPILHASSLIAGLLGQTFFMPFALTTFSILGRLRVLVLQCLHDIVDTFNLFSAWALEKGLFDTDSHVLPAALECKWDGMKLSLGATFRHHQQDICVENEGFVEDCNGRKYSVLGSLVSGDTAWEHEQAKEMIPSTDLIAKANGDNEPVLDIRTPSIEKTDVCNSKDKQDGLIQEKVKDTGVCIYSIDVPKKKVAYVSVHSPFRLQKEKKVEELHPPKRRKTDTLFVSVHSPFCLEKEKKEEELHPPKRRKTDTLFNMLLGLGDGTHKYIL